MHASDDPKLRRIAVAAALVALAAGAAAQARISDNVVRIGVLTDLSGVSSDNAGKGSIVAAQLAIDEFSKDRKVLGVPIELISADSQGKTDIGATKAREWYDQNGVDMITDLTYSNVALAVTRIADERRSSRWSPAPAPPPSATTNAPPTAFTGCTTPIRWPTAPCPR